MLHQPEVPQRVTRVQRLQRQFGQARLQGLLRMGFGRGRQLVALHMAPDVETGVGHPTRTGGILHHFLPKTRVFQQTRFDALASGRVTDCRLDDPHPQDHHQIGGAVHAQPGGVDLAHALVHRAGGRVGRGGAGAGAMQTCDHVNSFGKVLYFAIKTPVRISLEQAQRFP